MQADSLDQFYRTLTRILERERPDAYRSPVTVAELYQDIVPYRRMREALGIELHADYEHMLLRMLAGEDARVRIEPAEVREELAAEASAAEPNLSAYRRFAACEVVVAPPDGVAPVAGSVNGSGSGQAGSRAAREARAVGDRPPEAAPQQDGGVAGTGEAAASEPVTCRFCSEALPLQADVRYCPHCGADQRQRPCRACGQPLEAGWRFCTACGSAADG